jgi:PAS domain S-box-containing protein
MAKAALTRVESVVHELSYDGLFAATPDPTVIIEARGGFIVSANAAAARLSGIPRSALSGMPFAALLDSNSAVILREALETVRGAGVARIATVRFRGSEADLSARLSLVRSGSASYVLAHFGGPAANHAFRSLVYDAIDSGTMVLAISDLDLNLLYANRACLGLFEVGTLQDLHGQPLARWIQFSGNDLERLQAQMRSREMATVIAGELCARRQPLNALAVAIPDEGRSLWAFIISAGSRIN